MPQAIQNFKFDLKILIIEESLKTKLKINLGLDYNLTKSI